MSVPGSLQDLPHNYILCPDAGGFSFSLFFVRKNLTFSSFLELGRCKKKGIAKMLFSPVTVTTSTGTSCASSSRAAVREAGAAVDRSVTAVGAEEAGSATSRGGPTTASLLLVSLYLGIFFVREFWIMDKNVADFSCAAHSWAE
jgi:hypothetical protein